MKTNDRIDSMTHNACYATHTKYNYIVEWWQCADINGRRGIRRLVDTYIDYTAYGALAQFEKRHYINPTVISVYRHSPYTPAEV